MKLPSVSARLFVVPLLLTLALSGLAPLAIPEAAKAAGTAKIMVVGDSISQGLEGDYTWRYRLKQHLTSSGVTADFLGPWSGTNVVPSERPSDGSSIPARHDGDYRPGITFSDNQNLAQWGWQAAQAKWEIAENVRTYMPEYLLVELGFNDLGWGVSGPQGTVDSLRELVVNARAANPDIKILMANVPQRSPLESQPGLPDKISTFNQLLPSMASSVTTTRSPVSVVDFNAPYSYSSDSYDGLHPNVRGEFVIAKAFADALSSRLGVGSGYGAIPTSIPSDLTPSAPTGLTTQKIGMNLRVAWDHRFGVSGYRLFRRNVTTNSAWIEYTYAIAADSWTDTALAAGQTYEFKIRSARGDWSSSESGTVRGTVEALATVPDVQVSTSRSNPHAVTVSWGSVANATDYRVYAASGELNIGGTTCSPNYVPPESAFKLVQWNLADKRSWTQTFVTDGCPLYSVVAYRNGGEGPRSAPKMAWPYRGNLVYESAKRSYFTGTPGTGDRMASTSVAGGVDHGIVVGRGFIRDANAFYDSIGDHRSFSSVPGASSKVAVAWDTASGEIGVYVHRSCVLGQLYGEYVCNNSYPISFVSNAAAYGDSDISKANYVSVSKSGSDLIVSVSAMNSFESLNPTNTPAMGRINATFRLTPSGRTYDVTMTSDRFPAWEFIRYERVKQMGDPNATVLGIRDQTVAEDLKRPQVTCRSYGESSETSSYPVMSC